MPKGHRRATKYVLYWKGNDIEGKREDLLVKNPEVEEVPISSAHDIYDRDMNIVPAAMTSIEFIYTKRIMKSLQPIFASSPTDKQTFISIGRKILQLSCSINGEYLGRGSLQSLPAPLETRNPEKVTLIMSGMAIRSYEGTKRQHWIGWTNWGNSSNLSWRRNMNLSWYFMWLTRYRRMERKSAILKYSHKKIESRTDSSSPHWQCWKDTFSTRNKI